MTRLYGLKACDTCRKALKSLKNAGIDVAFQDVRETPLTQGEIVRFLDEFGEKLINTRSTTWRGLDEKTRSLPHLDLLTAHPTLMKRPVIETENQMTLGWSADIAASHLRS